MDKEYPFKQPSKIFISSLTNILEKGNFDGDFCTCCFFVNWSIQELLSPCFYFYFYFYLFIYLFLFLLLFFICLILFIIIIIIYFIIIIFNK